jgi:hypothetical protein
VIVMGGGRDATETGTPVDMQYGGADSEEAGRQQHQRNSPGDERRRFDDVDDF